MNFSILDVVQWQTSGERANGSSNEESFCVIIKIMLQTCCDSRQTCIDNVDRFKKLKVVE
jgi:hypothetical protein